MADSGAKSLADTADKINLGYGFHGSWADLYLQLLRGYDVHPSTYRATTAIGFVEDLKIDQPASEDLYQWLSVETLEG